MGLIVRISIFFGLVFNASVASTQNLPMGIIPSVPSVPVQYVQTTDPSLKILQLEEQVRQLTGRLEELGFQMLQMQEQMRQMQQDNEFRFQDLENAKSSDQANTGQKVDRLNGGTADIALGEATFDSAGNLVGGGEVDSSVGSDAEQIYKSGYADVLAGNYAQATQTFQNYLSLYPDGAQAADAQYWLGESLYSQGDFKEAARTFLEAHKSFPEAVKAPDTLLKLGMSLVALDNRETACVTYDEVLARYPSASKAIQDKVASEKSRAQC